MAPAEIKSADNRVADELLGRSWSPITNIIRPKAQSSHPMIIPAKATELSKPTNSAAALSNSPDKKQTIGSLSVVIVGSRITGLM